jgi:hypothetical protein
VGIDLPAVIGDPAGMRALAAALRSTASNTASADEAVWSRATAMQFTGPAATRIAGTIRAWHGEVSGAAQQLAETAALLERSAADVEAEQAARARLLQQLEEQQRRERQHR